LSVKLLLVDDRKENLFALGSLLEELNVAIFKCESGVEALNLMLDHDFALAIVDVQMPDIDGFELAELIRGAEKTKNVPIIFITAATENSGFAFKGYESGAVDFLYKPVDPLVLKSKVQVFMELDTQKRLLKAQVEELRASKEAAEKANLLKSSFLANMSHEIRTPLGALMGFTELLREDNLEHDKKFEYLDIMERNGQVLIRLIDDILDLSKVEAGHLEVEHLPFSPRNLTKEVLDLLREKAGKKDIELKFESSPDFEAEVVSDPTRLRQILTNIVGNAIKFTEKGSVTVTASVVPAGRGKSEMLSFLVTDTGIGLDTDQQSRLFQSFVQADNTMSRRFGGTGLGLVLSKRLAKLLGGDVTLVESAPHKGSSFAVTVKAQPQLKTATFVPEVKTVEAPPVVDNKKNKKLDGMRVLVVDDSEDNQYLLERILTDWGIQVAFASNGEEAIEKALSEEFDLILMDIQMPVLDGFESTARLRKQHYSKPIIALTANAMREDREKCLKMGFNDYLMKPINRGELLQKVAYFSGQHTASAH